MSLVRWKKDEVMKTALKGSGAGPPPPLPPHTTLAAIESLAVPLVQEVVFLADFRCSKCQQRVAAIMSKMNVMYYDPMRKILRRSGTSEISIVIKWVTH